MYFINSHDILTAYQVSVLAWEELEKQGKSKNILSDWAFIINWQNSVNKTILSTGTKGSNKGFYTKSVITSIGHKI